jgi:hypothetical protein
METKWTNNQFYERSRRIKHQIEMEKKTFENKIETDAFSSSLNYDENTWDLLNQISTGVKIGCNMRENLDSKFSERKLIQQTIVNPFHTGNNYVDDVSNRDKFLKPINTTSN